jgi:hypothetical protein
MEFPGVASIAILVLDAAQLDHLPGGETVYRLLQSRDEFSVWIDESDFHDVDLLVMSHGPATARNLRLAARAQRSARWIVGPCWLRSLTAIRDPQTVAKYRYECGTG